MNELPQEPAQAAVEVQVDGSVGQWLRRMNWAVAFVVFLVVGGVVGFNLSKAKNPKCGLDWIMAACGSEKTFESMIQGAIAESQEDFKEQNPELFQAKFEFSEPMQIEPIDLRSFNGFDPAAFDR
jgi:hypothetical protein